MTTNTCRHCGRVYDDAAPCTSDDCPGAELKCPENIDHWSVDSVAECIDGLSEVTYCHLWNEFVPNVASPDPDAETPLLKDVWSKLSPAMKEDIIKGALALIAEEASQETSL